MSRNQVLLAARHCSARHVWPVVAAQLLWGAVAVRHGRGMAWVRGKIQGLGLFRASRGRNPQRDRELLAGVLRTNEQFIRTANRDKYWRLYFLLTGGAK